MARGMKVMIDPALPDHRKVRALARELKVPPMQALGHLVSLWCRVMKECPTGEIGAWDAHDIADAAKWEGDPKAFVAALRAKPSRFLDRSEVHDWIEEQGDKVAEREAARKRKAKQRAEARAKQEEEERLKSTGYKHVPRDYQPVTPGQSHGGTSLRSRPPVPFPSVPSQQQQPVPSVPSQDTDAAPAAPPTDDDGGTREGTAVAVRDPLLAAVSIRRSTELLESVGVDFRVIPELCAARPVGEILDIVVEARGKRRPAGHARRAIEKGWTAPVCVGPEVAELLLQLQDDEARAQRHFGGTSRGAPERKPGETEDEWLRRIQDEKRRGSA